MDLPEPSARLLIDGHERPFIDARDRGLQYGDGLFETLAVLEGGVRRFEAHWTRLLRGCEKLGIPAPGRSTVEAEIARLAGGQRRAALKLIVTRGVAGRGYASPADATPTRILWLNPWPSFPAEWPRQGVIVRVCRTLLAEQPALAGIKHLNRLEQVLARREWTSTNEVDSCAEGLMRDASGAVVCGTMTNIFAIQGGRLLTPPLDRCGVAGTVRAAVIAAAPGLGLAAEERRITLEDLCAADEVFLTNALIGVWPVRRIENRACRSGPLTRRLQEIVERDVPPSGRSGP